MHEQFQPEQVGAHSRQRVITVVVDGVVRSFVEVTPGSAADVRSGNDYLSDPNGRRHVDVHSNVISYRCDAPIPGQYAVLDSVFEAVEKMRSEQGGAAAKERQLPPQ